MSNLLAITSETASLMQREMAYNLNLLISKKLLEKGLITQAEYDKIDTIFKQKYCPSLSVFVSENS